MFNEFKPHVIFHVAAQKHVAFLEKNPEAAIITNVLGTLNVLHAANDHHVERFVNVSTDKAADPISVLGKTKRVGERLTAHFGGHNEGFMSVRFGNVLGSNGSVVETFRHQLSEDLPVTVTDPEVTRYFMTIEEAVRLVVQAGAYEGNGDVFVLEMGEPVKIINLARRLAAEVTPGRPPEIVFTGLGPGEKLHEQLVSADDEMIAKPHDKLTRMRVPPSTRRGSNSPRPRPIPLLGFDLWRCCFPIRNPSIYALIDSDVTLDRGVWRLRPDPSILDRLDGS